MGLFREYDLRGIVGKELTADIAELVGRAYCTHVRGRGAQTSPWGVMAGSVLQSCITRWSRDCLPAASM